MRRKSLENLRRRLEEYREKLVREQLELMEKIEKLIKGEL